MSGYTKTSAPLPTDKNLVMACFLAQAVITKEDVEAMVKRQMTMLKMDVPALPELKAELRSFEFFGKYSDIMHNAFGEDMKRADAVTSKEVMKCCFLAKAFVKKETFESQVKKQFEMLGKASVPTFTDHGDKLVYHEFLLAYTAAFELEAMFSPTLLKILFQLHGSLDKAKYLEVVSHQLEMMHIDADQVSDEGLEDPMPYRVFITSYKVMFAMQEEKMGKELPEGQASTITDMLFSLHATITAESFKKLVEGQAKLLKKAAPDCSSVPPAMCGPVFNKTYKEVMKSIF